MQTSVEAKEKELFMELNLNDLKYLSVRFLFFNWFFNSGGEIATQLIDNVTKLYLKNINREDIINEIRSWKGNESHNIRRIIELLNSRLNLRFDINAHGTTLDEIYKLYLVRYIDKLKDIGKVNVYLKNLDTIDYTYKFFRDLIKKQVPADKKDEFMIDKIFLAGNDLNWGEDKISLNSIFKRNNKFF